MAVPFASLIPQRSRVLPQGGAILGQLTGSFQRGLEQGRLRAAEDEAPGLIMDYLGAQAAGYQPTLGSLAAPYPGGPSTAPRTNQPAGYNGAPTQANADMQAALTPGSPTFDGRVAMRRENASQQNAPLPSGVDAGVRLLDEFEGFRATPYEDWSYRAGTGERYMSGMRIGYGQDATGLPATVTQDQAQALLRQQIEQQYIPSIVDTIGADRWGALDANQQGVLISLVHNYGSLPNRIVDELLAGDPAATSAAIAALGGDNNGINQGRRASEAATFSGSGLPAGGGAATAGTGGTQTQPGGWQPPTGQERASLRAMFMGAWATGDPNMRQWALQQLSARMTPPAPTTPNYGFTEVNGALYATDPTTGRATIAAGTPTPTAPPAREIKADQNGVPRYTDTGQQVFPDVQANATAQPVRTLLSQEDGQLHDYMFDPATGGFTKDQGLADPGGQWGVTVGPDGTITMSQGRGGTAAQTDSQRRQTSLYSVVQPEVAIVDQVWPALSQITNQAAGAVPLVGNFLTSEDYQRGVQSVSVIIRQYLYSTSGQAVTQSEAEAQAQALLPAPGDQPGTVRDKLARIHTMVDAIARASGQTPASQQQPAAAAPTPAATTVPTTPGAFDYDPVTRTFVPRAP